MPDFYTKIPNEIIAAMPQLKDSEFRVLIFILRKTVGWGKTEDTISISQLVEGTGLSRRSVIYAVQNLHRCNKITVAGEAGKALKYSVILSSFCTSAEIAPVQNTTCAGAICDTELVQNLHPQKKVLQNKILQNKHTAPAARECARDNPEGTMSKVCAAHGGASVRNPLDIDLPEPDTLDLSPLAEPLQLYAEKCFRFSRTGIDAALIHACHEVGVETVRLALLQCVQLCEDPAFDKRYLPQLTRLLNTTDDLHKRAALYIPPMPETRASPYDPANAARERDAETVEWVESMTDDERERQFRFAAENKLIWPEEVKTRWKHLLQQTA